MRFGSCNHGYQEHNLPAPPPLALTEHRAHAVRCPGCRQRTRISFPTGLDGPVRFGRCLEVLAALRYAQYLPTVRLQDPVAKAAWHDAVDRHGRNHLPACTARRQAQALVILVACMDKTDLLVTGRTLWLYVLGNGDVTCYRVEGRGDVWTGYVAVAGHDRFGVYTRRLPEERNRLRPLQRPPAAQPGGDQCAWTIVSQTAVCGTGTAC